MITYCQNSYYQYSSKLLWSKNSSWKIPACGIQCKMGELWKNDLLLTVAKKKRKLGFSCWLNTAHTFYLKSMSILKSFKNSVLLHWRLFLPQWKTQKLLNNKFIYYFDKVIDQGTSPIFFKNHEFLFVDHPTSDILHFNKLSCCMRNSQKTETELDNWPMEWQTRWH